jgi:hypothetical protein
MRLVVFTHTVMGNIPVGFGADCGLKGREPNRPVMNVREQLFEIERTFVPEHLFDSQRPRLFGLNRESKGLSTPSEGSLSFSQRHLRWIM